MKTAVVNELRERLELIFVFAENTEDLNKTSKHYDVALRAEDYVDFTFICEMIRTSMTREQYNRYRKSFLCDIGQGAFLIEKIVFNESNPYHLTPI